MRPVGRFICWLLALTQCVATAQTTDLGYPAPTIHNSGQRASAVPLPALPNNSGPATAHPSNAAWVTSPSATTNATQASDARALGARASGAQGHVTQASYSTPVANPDPTQAVSPVAKRTPLNAKKVDTSLSEGNKSGSNTLQMLFSVGSSLLIVLGLFLGVAWCYRKTLNTSLGGIPKQVVSVLGRTAIAPRQQLILVRFGPKLVLVSMNQGETRAISEITDPIEVDQLAGSCESHQPHSLTNSFRSILNQSGGAV